MPSKRMALKNQEFKPKKPICAQFSIKLELTIKVEIQADDLIITEIDARKRVLERAQDGMHISLNRYCKLIKATATDAIERLTA